MLDGPKASQQWIAKNLDLKDDDVDYLAVLGAPSTTWSRPRSLAS